MESVEILKALKLIGYDNDIDINNDLYDYSREQELVTA